MQVGGSDRGLKNNTPGGTSPELQFHVESQFGFLVKPVLACQAEFLTRHTSLNIPGTCDYSTNVHCMNALFMSLINSRKMCFLKSKRVLKQYFKKKEVIA